MTIQPAQATSHSLRGRPIYEVDVSKYDITKVISNVAIKLAMFKSADENYFREYELEEKHGCVPSKEPTIEKEPCDTTASAAFRVPVNVAVFAGDSIFDLLSIKNSLGGSIDFEDASVEHIRVLHYDNNRYRIIGMSPRYGQARFPTDSSTDVFYTEVDNPKMFHSIGTLMEIYGPYEDKLKTWKTNTKDTTFIEAMELLISYFNSFDYDQAIFDLIDTFENIYELPDLHRNYDQFSKLKTEHPVIDRLCSILCYEWSTTDGGCV